MMDILLLICIGAFATAAVMAPFAFALAYVWSDTFYPQFISYNILNNAPVSSTLGALMLAFYLLADRKQMPKATGLLSLFGLLAICITYTSFNAVMPAAALVKYDPSIKVLLVSAFLPFVFNTRIRIEAFILVLIFAASAHILPWGIKTLLSGGGYRKSLGLLQTNDVALSESSTMANFVFACLPLLVFIARHSLLLNMKARTRQIFLTGIGLLFGVGAVGTYARTALISLAAVLGGFFLRSRRKMLFASVAVLFAIVAAVFASEGWKDRMETITDYQDESSAETRIIIWKWAWDFVQEHPLGGGFESYMVQDVETDQIGADGEHVHVRGRAFHSIYFAILAEHGFIGLGLFLAIVLGCLRGLWQTKQQTKTRTDLAWLNDLSSNLLIGLPAFLCGAAFIDISFYPVLWYQLALAVCVRSVALRSLAEPLPEPEPVAA